jgi:hypothetical protein
MNFSEGDSCLLGPANSFLRGILTKGDSMSGRSEELLKSLSVSSITSFPHVESDSGCLFSPFHVHPNLLQLVHGNSGKLHSDKILPGVWLIKTTDNN